MQAIILLFRKFLTQLEKRIILANYFSKYWKHEPGAGNQSVFPINASHIKAAVPLVQQTYLSANSPFPFFNFYDQLTVKLHVAVQNCGLVDSWFKHWTVSVLPDPVERPWSVWLQRCQISRPHTLDLSLTLTPATNKVTHLSYILKKKMAAQIFPENSRREIQTYITTRQHHSMPLYWLNWMVVRVVHQYSRYSMYQML